LKTAALAIAGGMVAPQLFSACAGTAKAKKHIGIQLYSLRDDIGNLGIQKVVEVVAKIGYDHVEAASYNDGTLYGLSPQEFRKLLDDNGLKLTSSHLVRALSDDYDADMKWWQKAIEAHATLGAKYLVMPWAPLEGEHATLDNIKRYGEYFSSIGQFAATANIRFGYHNHSHEFKTKIDIDGVETPVYDLLIENSSPQHVLFQNDVYWTQVGGYNPVDYMNKYPDRIKLLHIKDEKTIGKSGKMDFKSIFEAAHANGIKDWWVEIEQYDVDAQTDSKNSYDFLNSAEYV
jgi:sugar phosphate isomerase/epimerase